MRSHSKALFGTGSGAANRRTMKPHNRSTRPALEALEDRLAPATWNDPGFGDFQAPWRYDKAILSDDGALTIYGNTRGNNVTIHQDDSLNSLRVVVDGLTYEFRSSDVLEISADLGAGNDTLKYTTQPGTDIVHAKTMMSFRLGGGEDFAGFYLATQGKAGSATILNAVVLDVDMGADKDYLDVAVGAIDGLGSLQLNANLRDSGVAGAETAQINFWGDLTRGGAATVSVHGGAGADVINAWMFYDSKTQQYNDIDIDAQSSMFIQIMGGDGDDMIEEKYFGTLKGSLTMNAYGDDWTASTGRDDIKVAFGVDADSSGTLTGNVDGQAGDDKLYLGSSGQGSSYTRFSLRGGSGTDSAEVTETVLVDADVESKKIVPW